jgi:hypothetical protein
VILEKGDIIFSQYNFKKDKRLFLLEDVLPFKWRCMFRDKKINNTSLTFYGSFDVSNIRMATDEEIAFVKANIEAGYLTLDSSMVELLQTRNKGVPEVTNPELLGSKPTCNKHEPIRYVSFNMVYTICKNCDKTLA